ncbi:glutathione S-transferase family protein [Alsobacter sp. R-9]
MKLYDSVFAPNPRRVRIFLAEKGISVPTETIDLAKLEQKAEDFTRLNPLQRTPALVLDDGAVLTESVAICRYFEELQPEPALFGRSAREKAFVEMWNRRVELGLFASVAAVFRHLHPAMAAMEEQMPAWGEANKPRMMEHLAFLDRELAGREFIAGDAYSIADITALCAVDFMRPTRIRVPEDHVHLLRWHAAVSERPSAKA